MIEVILKALTSRIGALISAGLAALLLLGVIGLKLQIHSLHTQIAHLEARIEAAQRDLGTCRANTATLQAGIASQNLAIERERAARAARVAQLDQIASSARAEAQTAQSRANAILHRPRTGNACVDADAAILENAH